MDWTLAVNRNRDALLRIIAGMFAYAGLAEGAAFIALPRPVYRAFLRVLRPAESAVRRLIVILAHGLVLKIVAARAAPVGLIPNANAGAARLPAFPLIDPLKRFVPVDASAQQGLEFVDWDEEEADNSYEVAPFPRISTPGFIDRAVMAPVVPSADGPIKAAHLSRRIAAMKRALENLNREARRLARWYARRDLAVKTVPYKPRRMTPFRPGSPPGAKLKRVHEVDHVLRECHDLVKDLWADSS